MSPAFTGFALPAGSGGEAGAVIDSRRLKPALRQSCLGLRNTWAEFLGERDCELLRFRTRRVRTTMEGDAGVRSEAER